MRKLDEEVHLSNPAGRLLLALVSAKAWSGQSQNAHKSAIEMWRAALKLPDDSSDPIVYHRIAGLLQLPGEIERHIERLRLDKRTYLDEWRDEFSRSVTHAHSTQALAFHKNLPDSCITCLTFVSQRLYEAGVETHIPVKELAGIEKEVHSLSDSVTASTLPDELKEFLLRQLELIQRSIQEYRISGSGQLDRAVRTVIGSLALEKDVAKPALDSEPGKNLWKIISRISLALNVMNSIPKLADALSRLLPK